MKTFAFLKPLFIALLLTTMSLTAAAYDFIVDGIAYNINSNGATVSVVGGGNYNGDVIIPESVVYNDNSFSVSAIGDHAFSGCGGLVSVIIGKSVSSIDEYSFWNCKGLTSVSIPNTVVSIGNGAFGNCSALMSVNIPNSVTIISPKTFGNCTSLTSIELPNSITIIGDGAFSGSGLISIDIPNSVTSIGGSAFQNCTFLSNVFIPNSVTSIGGSAFRNCTFLSNIFIPKSVTFLGEGVIQSCKSLNSIVVEEGNLVYNSHDSCNAIIESSTNNLLYGCKNTIIPNFVTSISDAAFFNCSELTEISIGNSVISIGREAFHNCTGLTNIVIPNSVKSIGTESFLNCSALESVTLGENVSSIGSGAFFGANNITTVICKRIRPANVDGDYGFFSSNVYNNATLYVPKSGYSMYCSLPYWMNFVDIQEIDDGGQTPLKGDVNDDGKVNVSDVTALINIILGVI